MIKRARQTKRNKVPIITWSPWNPVATKNVVPNTLSAILKEASKYSKAWRAVKYRPKNTVRKSPCLALFRSPLIIAWWDQVTLIPEDRRIIVFKSGTWIGLKGLTPRGGQVAPISTAGARLLWKKAQKKEKKKSTSEVIKRIMPNRRPSSTNPLWRPWRAPSWLTSRHHWIIVKIIIVNPRNIKLGWEEWNHLTRPLVRARAPKADTKGQGDSSTKW